MNKKCFEVIVSAVCSVFVEDAKDIEEAYALARESLSRGDFSDMSMQGHELTSDADIASCRRHADVRSCP